MADAYIRRDDAIELLQNAQFEYTAEEAVEFVSRIPAADVAPVKHGRWLSKEYMYGDPSVGVEDMWIDRLAEQSDYYAYCSICGKDAEYNAEGRLILSDYCPNCGAKMDGGTDK